VEWAGSRAMVRLPDHIDLSNAGPIAEELLALINRGPDALIVDMTATASCDYAGAEALVRAYRRAVASGTQLRLVMPAPVVRSLLTLNGLDRLVSVYPSREAAIVAAPPAAQGAAGAGPSHLGQDLLDRIVDNLYHAGLSLQAALDSSNKADRPHIARALQYVDDTIREIRNQVFTAGRPEVPPVCGPPDGAQ
jgi:anti-sigma B factor antagonist